MAKPPSAKRPASKSEDLVFLNVPYDSLFAPNSLAYVCGAFGLIPRATLELQGGTRRLDRIVSLVENCRYSIHDMSRMELDTTPPPTPRFNMPFSSGFGSTRKPQSQKSHLVLVRIGQLADPEVAFGSEWNRLLHS
jgi:hypothetical protein